MPHVLKLFAAGLLLSMLSCANPVNLLNSSKYYGAAHTHSRAGNHQQAAVLYSRCLINARLGRAKPAAMAAAHYGYGRELALIGEFDEGIENLTESLRIERSIEPVNRIEVLRINSVLGRIFLDTGRFDEAHVHLQEAYGLLVELEASDSPAGRLFLAKDILKAAEGSGSASAIEAARANLDALLLEHGDLDSSFPIERFTPDDVAARLEADLSPEKFRRSAP